MKARIIWVGFCLMMISNCLLYLENIHAGQSSKPAKSKQQNSQKDSSASMSLHTINVDKAGFLINFESFNSHMPNFDQVHSDVSKGKGVNIAKDLIRMSAIPNAAAANDGKIELAKGSKVPFLFASDASGKMAVKIVIDAPGTQFTASAGVVVGNKKIIKGTLVSTIKSDVDGSIVHSFDGTENGTQISDSERKEIYEYNSDGKWVKIPTPAPQ